MQRCLSCQGKKKVMGIGLIEKDCPTCEGKGMVNKYEITSSGPVNEIEEKLIESPSIPSKNPEKSKRGRPSSKGKAQHG